MNNGWRARSVSKSTMQSQSITKKSPVHPSHTCGQFSLVLFFMKCPKIRKIDLKTGIMKAEEPNVLKVKYLLLDYV